MVDPPLPPCSIFPGKLKSLVYMVSICCNITKEREGRMKDDFVRNSLFPLLFPSRHLTAQS